MQLDNTRIAIRERGLAETFDLALQVSREFFGPILGLSLLMIVPLAAINYFLVGWMAPVDMDDEFIGWRYMWNMSVLIYLEAPLASVLVTAYLGPAVFLEDKRTRQVLIDVLRCLPQLFLCQFLLRGILPAWLLYLAVDRYSYNGFLEGFVLTCLALYAMGLRAIRPYINEIVLLERNPLRARGTSAITINKRSAHLHGPYASDLIARWIISVMIAALLLGLSVMTVIVLKGVLTSDWPVYMELVPEQQLMVDIDWIDYQILFPLAMWTVVALMSVVRFLSYLDLRIKHEGWEVELLMRAEAIRLATRME
jgi:hypothetical protein